MVNRVLWLIGLSGAGKTTIAEAAASRFGAELLDGDTIRDFFSNNDFSREGRERHLLGIARMAKMISKHTDVICSFITPYEDVRKKILQILPENSVMIHVSTSLEICEERDIKGLYAKARLGVISNFTGISDPFDEPHCAHMTLNSTGRDGETIEDMVDKLSHYFEKPKAVLLPGRWQPLHVGHEWLIQQELDKGKRVVVGIRDTPITESDPYPAEVRKRMIEYRYEGENLEVLIDMGSIMDLKSIEISFLQNQGSWIFFPLNVEFSFSKDRVDFQDYKQINNKLVMSYAHEVKNFIIDLSVISQIQYIKIKAKSLLVCPDWHPGSGGKAWLFADEVVVR